MMVGCIQVRSFARLKHKCQDCRLLKENDDSMPVCGCCHSSISAPAHMNSRMAVRLLVENRSSRHFSRSSLKSNCYRSHPLLSHSCITIQQFDSVSTDSSVDTLISEASPNLEMRLLELYLTARASLSRLALKYLTACLYVDRTSFISYSPPSILVTSCFALPNKNLFCRAAKRALSMKT